MAPRLTLLLVAGSLIALAGIHAAYAQQLEQASTVPFGYSEGFEGAEDPVKFWTSYDKKYTVNFKGLTDEKAHSGKQSFKLDVTFEQASRFLWHIALEEPVPSVGELRFSGHMLLGEGTTGTATLGQSFRLPPTSHQGCTSPYKFYSSTQGKWQALEGDCVARGRQVADGVMGIFSAGARGENVGVLLEKIIFDLRGEAGQRVVLYVDDLRLSGEIPTEAAYARETADRWAPIKETYTERLASWQAVLDKAARDLALLDDLSPRAEQLRRGSQAEVAAARAKIQATRAAGDIRKTQQDEIQGFFRRLEHVSAIQAISDAEKAGRSVITYVVPPVAAAMVLPDQQMVPGEPSSELSVVAARGEYEPASFVVSTFADLNDLSVTVSDLRGDNGTIPAARVDVKAVKCWYQAGTAWVGIRQDKSRRLLIPELLLNDDALVRVDEESKENHLKLSFPDGPKYVWISDPTDVRRGGSVSVEAFPVKDSPVLLPLDIPAGRSKQFWLTVHVPEDAAAGKYAGTISLNTPAGQVDELTLTLTVLPFELLGPYYTSSMDYHGRPGPGAGTIGSWGKSWTQFRAELKNMVAHGLRNCQHYGITETVLEDVLKVRQEVGMDNGTLYLKGAIPIGNVTEPEALQAIKDNVRKILKLTKPYGTETVYFYGIDEKRGEELAAQRPAWEAVRQAGGKIFVAGWADNIELMGDIQDMHVRAGWPDAEEVARWHAFGHMIFCYANPQTGVENPVVYRRNFGLLLWKYDYDGAATNAYQHTFGATWNDFDHVTYRAHTIAYPTVDGVIDTIAWEGYREGVDDVRYMTTLQKAIQRAEGSQDEATVRAAKAARAYIHHLKTTTAIETGDLDAMRRQIIGHILALQGNA